MKKLLLTLLIAALTISTVQAGDYAINGWRLKAYLCSIGIGPCPVHVPCQWKPCGKKK